MNSLLQTEVSALSEWLLLSEDKIATPVAGFLLLLPNKSGQVNCYTNNGGSIALLAYGMAVNPAPAARTGQ